VGTWGVERKGSAVADDSAVNGVGFVFPTLAQKQERAKDGAPGELPKVGHPGFAVSHPVDRKKSTGWGTGQKSNRRSFDSVRYADFAQDDTLF
jgi:hypothetical protein